MEKKRFIKLYPDMVAVCTIGPIGDGIDNIVEEYPGCHVETYYSATYIIDRKGTAKATYSTDSIIMITK